jgi:hypothetical protein
MLLLPVVQALAQKNGGVTFYKDIQPTIFRNCTSCHRPGQSGPFPLISYNDVRKHAAMIKHVTGTGYMPPWKADTAYRHFTDERVLSAAEVAAIAEWVAKGTPAGNERDGVAMPVISKPSNLGQPDLVLTAPEVFKVPGNNADTVAYFIMHYSIPTDTNVLAFEFTPGNPVAVHHSNTWVFPEPSEYDRIYEAIPTEVIPAPVMLPEQVPTVYQMLICFDFGAPLPPPMAEGGFEYPDFFPRVAPLYYDGWVPGATARTWPPGFGFKLPNKGVLIMQIHYGPTPVELVDQSSINMFFTPRPITRLIESYNIGTGGGIAEPEPALSLPPDSVSTFVITAEVGEDQSYIALNPHMHYLGREMKAFAIAPAGDTIPLVWIKKWDFRWQEFYKPTSPIKVPKGALVKIVASYDNTAANPENRYSPPKRIVSGANSTDEMMSLIVMSVRYEPGDELMTLNSDQPVIASPPKNGSN